MDEKRFRRIAGREALGLRVVRNLHGHFKVDGFIDIGVADAVEVLDHRHRRLGHEARNEAFSASRNENVDIVAGADEFAHERAVGARNQLNGFCGKTGRAEAFCNDAGERAIAFKRLVAATQNDGVAGFESKGGGVHRHIGTGLIDHRDDAERYAHAADFNAGRHWTNFRNRSDGVGKLSNLNHAFRHPFENCLCDREAIDEGFAQAFSACGFKILFVCASDLRFSFDEELCNGSERQILLCRPGAGHFTRGAAGSFSDGFNEFLGRHGSRHG